MIKTKFKIGEKTHSIWSGDIVSECEFIADIGYGNMLFWDCRAKCFRRVYVGIDQDGKPYLNGWSSGKNPSDLLLK